MEEKKESVSVLQLTFLPGHNIKDCYEALFRALPFYEMNGCRFSHQKPDEEFGGYRIYIFAEDIRLLAHVWDLLMKSPAFLSTQVEKVLRRVELSCRVVEDGYVCRDKLELNYRNPSDAIMGGGQRAHGKQAFQAFSSEPSPVEAYCYHCKTFSKGKLFCNKCGKQIGNLRSFAKGFLVVALVIGCSNLLIIIPMLLLAWLPQIGEALLLLLIDMTLIFVGVILLFKCRKIGFWFLLGERLFDMILVSEYQFGNLVWEVIRMGDPSNDGTYILFSILYVVIAYICLMDDMKRMR